jgi:hypothetical protein
MHELLRHQPQEGNQVQEVRIQQPQAQSQRKQEAVILLHINFYGRMAGYPSDSVSYGSRPAGHLS